MGRLTANQRRELRALRQAFGLQLAERVRCIEQALDEAVGPGGVDRDRADAVFQLVHRLCGSAAIYGYRNVHDAASTLEYAIEVLRDARPAGPPIRAQRLLQALKQAAGLVTCRERAAVAARETLT
jgi:HPt (histidine-containing phosphotransfer) domain-containing protein